MSEIYRVPERSAPIPPPEMQPNVEKLVGRLGILHPVNDRWGMSAPMVYDYGTADIATVGFCYVETVGDDHMSSAFPYFTEALPAEPNRELQEMEALLTGVPDDEWHDTALCLLDQSEALASNDRMWLVGALICSLRTPEPGERMAFLKEVYGRGLAERMATACADSDITLIGEITKEDGLYPQPVVDAYRISSAAFMFRLERSLFDRYMHLLEGSMQQLSTERISARKTQDDLLAVISAGEHDSELADRAATASTRGYKVKGPILDPTKHERVALQRFFISKQKEAVLGDDLTNTPLARKLEELRTQTMILFSENIEPELIPLRKLQNDINMAFAMLSDPVIRDFARVSASSPEYQATLRFRQLKEELRQYYLVSQHIMGFQAARDHVFQESAIRSIIDERTDDPDPLEIWANSSTGAAVPNAIEDTLTNILSGVRNNPLLGAISAKGLSAFAQLHRHDLLAFATRHLNDFPIDLRIEKPLVGTDEHGTLRQQGTMAVVSKGALGTYGSATLGCPALREVHQSRQTLSQQELVALGHNYLENVLTIVINEAYARGIFDFVEADPAYSQLPLGVMKPATFM